MPITQIKKTLGLSFLLQFIITVSYCQTNFRLIPQAIYTIASDKTIADKTPQFYAGEKIVTKKEAYLYAIKESYPDSIVINIYANARLGMKPDGKLTEKCVFIMKNGLPVLDNWLNYPSLPYSKGGFGKKLSTRGVCFNDPNQYTVFENGIEKNTYTLRYDGQELQINKEKNLVLAYKRMDDILSDVKKQHCVINGDFVEIIPATPFWIEPNSNWTLFSLQDNHNNKGLVMNDQGDTIVGFGDGVASFSKNFIYKGYGLEQKMYLNNGTFIAKGVVCYENFENSELSALHYAGDSEAEYEFRTCCAFDHLPLVKTAYITKEGVIKVPAGDFYGEKFSDGMAAVLNNKNRWGFINTSGELVIPNTYNKVEPFKEGKAKVTLGERSFYIDKKGNEIP